MDTKLEKERLQQKLNAAAEQLKRSSLQHIAGPTSAEQIKRFPVQQLPSSTEQPKRAPISHGTTTAPSAVPVQQKTPIQHPAERPKLTSVSQVPIQVEQLKRTSVQQSSPIGSPSLQTRSRHDSISGRASKAAQLAVRDWAERNFRMGEKKATGGVKIMLSRGLAKPDALQDTIDTRLKYSEVSH